MHAHLYLNYLAERPITYYDGLEDVDGWCYLHLVRRPFRQLVIDELGKYPYGTAAASFIEANNCLVLNAWFTVEYKQGKNKKWYKHVTPGGIFPSDSVLNAIKGKYQVGASALTSDETGIIANNFLSSVIASPRGGRIPNSATFRRYVANVTTNATIGGNMDTRLSQIHYEVGRRHNTATEALLPARDIHRVEAAYPTGAALAEDFVGLAKKYTNFSATFEFTSLAGVVERLARGLATASVFGNITSSSLRGGEPLSVQALGTHDGPVNSLTTTVFIPRLVNSNITGDVFSVLVNAVAGEGGCVSTDILELDAITRQPMVPEVPEDDLGRAIVDALRLLGSNFIAVGQGPLFALALTRGIHRTVSVVGHTDEGAITRDLLRAGHFGVPFGGIHYGLGTYSGIPALSSDSHSQLAAYVDSLALTTAALVAHCDPGERLDGYWFPTFYNGTSANDDTLRAGQHLDGTAAMAARNAGQVLNKLSKFADLYLHGLGVLFNAAGDVRVPAVFFCTAAQSIDRNSRHFKYATIAPWFWIEPTSLIPAKFLGTQVELEGFGSYGNRESTQTRLGWEDICSTGPCDTAVSSYKVIMRSARTSWFLAHWNGHPENGLGVIKVKQLDPNAVIHPGPHPKHIELRDRVEANCSLDQFLWRRGQSPFAAPTEFMNISAALAFSVLHYTFDTDGVPNAEHVPSSFEFRDTSVTINVGIPTGRPSGAANTATSGARRARTLAARELGAASARTAIFGRSVVGELPTLTSAPIFDTRPRKRTDHEAPSLSGGAVGSSMLGSLAAAG